MKNNIRIRKAVLSFPASHKEEVFATRLRLTYPKLAELDVGGLVFAIRYIKVYLNDKNTRRFKRHLFPKKEKHHNLCASSLKEIKRLKRVGYTRQDIAAITGKTLCWVNQAEEGNLIGVNKSMLNRLQAAN